MYWRKEPTVTNELSTPLTIHQWSGKASITGAIVLSRLNLNFLNDTCTYLASELETAAQVAQVYANTKLAGVTNNQVNQYGALLLTLGKKYLKTLLYQKDLLLLCFGREGELWSNYRKVKNG